MGEIDLKSFENACKQNISKHDNLHGALLCSKWQDEISNPEWYPFEVIQVAGNQMVYISLLLLLHKSLSLVSCNRVSLGSQ
jgi:hypothetical protein